MKLSYPILFYCCALALSCNAQTSSISSNTAEAKANQIGEHIPEIFEDSQGNLWFGTAQKGVAKYDGKELTYLSEEEGLCGATVTDMVEEENGVLWFGTHMDLCKYENGSFTTLPRKDGRPILGWGWKDLGVGWKSVRTNRDGSIWVNTHHGIFSCDDPSLPLDQLNFTEFIIPFDSTLNGRFCNTPGAISLDFEDSKGNLWFGTDGNGVYYYDGKKFTQLTQSDGLLSNNVMAITEDAVGNIWIACVKTLDKEQQSGGVSVFDGTNFIDFPKLKGLHHNNIYTLYSDANQNIWVGANGTGVYRFNTKSGKALDQSFTLFQEPELANLEPSGHTSGLQSMLQDSKGNIWLGYSGGLFRLEGNQIINITTNGPW